MSTVADYFGLMAYLLVMHGGMPDDASLLTDESPRRSGDRRGSRLRVVGGRRSRRSPKNKTIASPAFDEAAA